MASPPNRWEYTEPEVKFLDLHEQEARFLCPTPEPSYWDWRPTVRPVCYLDLEQCLLLSIGDPPPTSEPGNLRRTYLTREHWGPHPLSVWVDRRLDFWLHELADRFELVLASDWGPDASAMAALLGQPDVETISAWPDELAQHASGRRPVAIVSSVSGRPDLVAKFLKPRQRYLSYQIDAAAGLTFDDVTRLVDWAQSLEPSAERALQKHRRAILGRCAKLGFERVTVVDFNSRFVVTDVTVQTIRLGVAAFVDPDVLHKLELDLSKLAGVAVEILDFEQHPSLLNAPRL